MRRLKRRLADHVWRTMIADERPRADDSHGSLAGKQRQAVQ